MMLLPWLLLQAGATTLPIPFDLATMKPAARPCATGSGGEIVVCARDEGSDRISVLPVAEDPLPKAEIGLFGQVRGGVGTQQASVGGFPSQRIMVKVKVPF
jgi:hypothetical protein